MISKKKYLPFRIEDLTGWINLRDYASEIEDKQCVSLKNWNFNWNKLVSEKWYLDTLNTPHSEIGALSVDAWDIWTVAQWALKKNWVDQWGKNAIVIKTDIQSFVPWIEYIITIDSIEYRFVWDSIADFINDVESKMTLAWFDVEKQSDSVFISSNSTITYSTSQNQTYLLYNRDDVAAYNVWDVIFVWVEINWTKYEYEYNYNNSLLNAGQVDIEIMTGLAWVIPASFSPSVVNLNSILEIVDDYTTYAGIIINNANTIAEVKAQKYKYRYKWYSALSWGYSYVRMDNGDDVLFELDGNPVYWPFGYWIRHTWPDALEATDSITIDWHVMTFPAATPTNTFGTVLKWMLDATWDFYSDDSSGNNRQVVFIRKDWNRISSISGTWIFSDINSFTLNSYSAQSHTSWSIYSIATDDCYDVWDWLALPTNNIGEYTERWIVNQINAFSWYNAASEWAIQINIEKDDKSQIIINEAVANPSDMEDASWNEITDIAVKFATFIDTWAFIDIKTNKKTEVDLINLQWSSNLIRGNLTIWNNWGVLFVDADEWGASYLYNDAIASIWEDEIGKPTVGTIYNGKIILGWYKWNDNIIFSKTSSPTQPLNILNFSDYSAGWQSVSGWDKWQVTWMIVGENGLYVFKDNSVWYSNSEKDNPDSFSFNLIFNKITSNGALNQNVITEVEQEIFYLDWKTRAVRRLWYEQNLTTLRDTSISKDIAELLEALPEDQTLATSHFSYPYYQLSLSNWQEPDVEYNNGNTYKTNMKHFIYNVENKSWTTKDGINDLIVSDSGYFALLNWSVYKDFQWNIREEWDMLSKEYTFGDDIMYKKYGRFEIIGRIIPEAEVTKTLTVEIIIDWEVIDERVFTRDSNSQLREKIDLMDIWQKFQFRLKHSWEGRVEIYDTQVYYKWTNIQPQDFS